MPASPQSDAVLSGDALGAALLRGFPALPGPGAATGPQALPAEAAAAERPERLLQALTTLVLWLREGKWNGRVREDTGNPRAERRLFPYLPPVLLSYTDLSGPACGSPHLFIILDLPPLSPAGKGKQPGAPREETSGLGRGYFQRLNPEK